MPVRSLAEGDLSGRPHWDDESYTPINKRMYADALISILGLTLMTVSFYTHPEFDRASFYAGAIPFVASSFDYLLARKKHWKKLAEKSGAMAEKLQTDPKTSMLSMPQGPVLYYLHEKVVPKAKVLFHGWKSRNRFKR